MFKGDIKMKRNIILTAVLSAMLLTGCSKETELIDDFETSGIPLPFQATQSAETEGDTQYILGGETETSVSVNESSAEEAYENMHMFNFAKLSQNGEYTAANNPVVRQYVKTFLNGNILCASCKVTNSDGTYSRKVLRFYNIDDETIEKNIVIPDSYNFEEFIGGGGDILCKAKLTHYISRNSVVFEEYSVMTVKKDYSVEYSEYDRQTAALPLSGHNITQWYNDIIDADTETKIVEGYESEGDGYRIEDVISQEYMFPIDENRFVYLTKGYEYTPCFGIYDFITGTAADVPDTEDLMPIGVRGGKIYSALKPWGKSPSDIYVTDIETLETVKSTDALAGEYCYYKMPEIGDKIAYLYDPKGVEFHNILGIANPDTGDIIEEYELPYDSIFSSDQLYFADNDTVVIIYDTIDKALIIDLQN